MSNERTSVSGVQECGGFYRRAITRLALALAALAPMQACVSVPVTGRSQFNMFSLDQDKELGTQAYADVMQQAKLRDSGPEFAMVKRVVDRLIAVADDPGFEWEVHVVDDPATVNAWCMPGGKMAVYTGILPVTEDDTGLAVVMAHEIGHAVARHGTARMSTQGLAQVGMQLLGAVSTTAAEYQQLIGQAADLLVFLPWGRDDELEADHIGLMYMARAGYDPRKAVDFWRRMAAQSEGSPPELLSTHPSDEHRVEQIQSLLPEALAAYESAAGRP